MQGTFAAVALMATRGRIEEPEAVRREREAALAEIAALPEAERAEAERALAEDPLFEDVPDGVAHARIAFGPFLALATLELLFAGPALQARLVAWFAPF